MGTWNLYFDMKMKMFLRMFPKFFEFMLENDEDLCTIYTFSQCPSCKEIGTLSEKFTNFNFISEEKCEHCTYLSEDVTSPMSNKHNDY